MRKLPGVLVFPAFRGITEFEKEKAKALAQEGYIALAADPFGKGIHPKDKAECFAIVRPMIIERSKLLKCVIVAAFDAIKAVQCVDVNKIGALGFCFGGLCALDLARYNVGLKAAISFHGTLTPIPDAPLDKIIETAVQVHHGDSDAHIPKEQVDGFHVEMRTRNADFVFSSHAHAEHGFTEPGRNSLRITLRYIFIFQMLILSDFPELNITKKLRIDHGHLLWLYLKKYFKSHIICII